MELETQCLFSCPCDTNQCRTDIVILRYPVGVVVGAEQPLFFASLAIAGIIAFENAFAIGEKARFYRQIIRELWAVDQEVNEAEFDDVDDYKQLNNVETELRQLIERDSQKIPAGQGLAAIRQIGKAR